MASGIFSLLWIIEAIVIIVLVSYIIWRLRGEKEEPNNAEMVINALSNYTKGHALGLKISEKRTNEKIAIEFAPRDIDYIKAKEEKIDIKNQHIYALKGSEHPFPLSAHRNMSIILPERGWMLPNKFLTTELGQFFYWFIEKKYAEKDALDIKNIREKNLFELIKQSPDGGMEAINTHIARIKNLQEELIINKIEEKTKD